jgi:hypothetical protein
MHKTLPKWHKTVQKWHIKRKIGTKPLEIDTKPKLHPKTTSLYASKRVTSILEYHFSFPKFPLSCKIENRGDTNELEGRFMAAANIKIGDDTGAITGHCIVAVLCP